MSAAATQTSIPPPTLPPSTAEIKSHPPLQLHKTGNLHTGTTTTTNTVKEIHNLHSPRARLEGKVAIVTGGAGGIGSATVHLFTKNGAKVIIADINTITGKALAATSSQSITFIYCDVTSETSIKSLIDQTITLHGKLDILVNTAGILDSHTRKSILTFDPDEFDRVINVNVKGVALAIKHAARAMMSGGGGGARSIVSIASVAGVMGGLGPQTYTASKHAIVGLTKNVACELGKYGIRVNCVSPFGVATPMLVNAWREDDDDDYDGDGVEKMEEFVRGLATLKGVTLKPEDVAEAVMYLASDESRYVSGHNLVVDGGFTSSKNVVGL